MNENVKQTDKQWISCRATPGCEGKQAVIVFKRPAGGMTTGTSIRYRCLLTETPSV